ncbi:MAG TPA: ABC transporter permease [Bryobacteraceae bacterium]|nr:ABC transporter permease [Bryobacteraceae bacterium]
MWARSSLESFWQDVRYGLRMMRRSPGFTAVAVISLALGIGANTAIFSLIDTVMLRMLPVREPQQLVELLEKYPGEPRGSYFSFPSYEYYRDHNHVFSELIGVYRSSFNVRGAGIDTEIADGRCVTANFFPVLGLKPAIGRLIGQEESHIGAASSAVAVLSWSYWKSRFNLDPAILGKQIIVDDVPLTVIGVAPPEFFGLQVGLKPDIWMPLAEEPIIHHPSRIGGGGIALMARLKPGVSIARASAEMSVLFQWTIEERARNSKDPLVRQLRLEIEPAGSGFPHLRDQFAKPLLLMMAVVGLLLLIACTNIASLLLARGAARRHEMALRVSLGAGRFRLVRQVLTESLLLSGAGGLLGIYLAYLAAAELARILASGRQIVRIAIPVQIDAHVLLFTAGVALFTGLLFGLAPAWNAFASAPASSLRETGRAGETKFRRLFGKSLVVAQVAISVVLLSAASLFVRYLSNLEHLDLGFRRDHVLLVTLDPAHGGYTGERLSIAYRELLGRLEAIPGVRSATITGPGPLSGAGASRFVTVEGHPERPEDRRYISISWVAPKYFETLGTPLLGGRGFNFRDGGGPRVAIVNEAMARYYFRGGNAIGKHFTFDGDTKPYEIVGVAGNAKYYEIREAALRTIYLNTFQSSDPASTFALRTSIDPEAVAPSVLRNVHELLKTIPVAHVTTLSDQVDATIVPERLMALLSSLFGALGSLLAAIGIYGLLAYTVTRRINEIGIRMALGATRSHVTRMVLSDALGMVCAGLAIGVPIAMWATRVAASLIPDLPAKSAVPVAFGAVAMIALALLAAYVPARRAAHVDPMEALRHE